jgi:Zn-dependent protease with chaperone function
MIEGTYFDGRNSRRQPVTLIVRKRVLAMRGPGGLHRSVRLSQCEISERLEHAPRILRFRDGGFIEIASPGFDRLLKENGYHDPMVVRWQQNWLFSLLALVTLLVLLISGYQWGLPWAADRLAQHLPTSVEKKIGDQGLKMIDARYIEPSRLAAADRMRLQRLFAGLRQPRGENTNYRLEFRHSRVGPNAFALPNGVIVLTDQLVIAAANDQAVLGVLAHELGHLQRRHTLRRLLQTLGTGVMVNLFVGDVSSVLAAVPTFLLDQKYSRDFEREADRYAIDMMHANSLPLSPMVDLFEKMRNGTGKDDGDAKHDDSPTPSAADDEGQDEDVPEYFSSHPSDAERIAILRAADTKR